MVNLSKAFGYRLSRYLGALFILRHKKSGIVTPKKVPINQIYNKMSHPQHLDGSVDKSEDFIREGKTLITEVESEKWLELHKKNKERSTEYEKWS
jgi:hypothetical protein